MGTDSLRLIISRARAREQATGELEAHFQAREDELADRLVLPESGAAGALVAFVEQYIEYVPDFIQSVSERAKVLDMQRSVSPFLNMAEDFFLAPPEEVGEDSGLLQLLDEAFLAHRLIEELNDRHIQERRMPLLPVDMTRANVIVHHLVGDELANRLDALVEQSVSLLVDQEHLFDRFGHSLETETSLLDIWQHLPCLSRDARIDLRLDAGR